MLALLAPEKLPRKIGVYVFEHCFSKNKEQMVEFVIANKDKLERHRDRILGCSQVDDVQEYFKDEFTPKQLTKCDPQNSGQCGFKDDSPHLLTPQTKPATTCGC